MNQKNKKKIALLTVCSALCLANASWGATYTWTGGSDNWTNAASWGGTVPTSTDVAQLTNGSTITVNTAGATAARLNSTSGTVEVTSGGTLALTGTGDTASFSLNGGSMLISGGAVTANASQNNFLQSGGSMTINSGSFSTGGNTRLGDGGGSGTLTISGTGTYSGGQLRQSVGTANVNLAGSSATITNLAQIRFDGGTNNFNLTLGNSGINAISMGSFLLGGTSTLSLGLLDYDVATYGPTVNLFRWTGSSLNNWDTININGTSLGSAIGITNNSITAFDDGLWSGNFVVDTTSATRSIYLSDLTLVPEPSTYALLALAAAGLGAHVVRRRKQ